VVLEPNTTGAVGANTPTSNAEEEEEEMIHPKNTTAVDAIEQQQVEQLSTPITELQPVE
jgi:hypothetical protein